MSKRRRPRTKALPGPTTPVRSQPGSAEAKDRDDTAARATRKAQHAGTSRRRVRRQGSSGRLWGIGLSAVALLGLLGIFLTGSGGGKTEGAGAFTFQVGEPGPGGRAPDVRLPSTAGGTFDLASLQGQRVLLYFQEGLGCQPCWDQINDIEQNVAAFEKLGIDRIVSITTDPLDLLGQKATDEGISTEVLSDPDLRVSKAYDANSYGMMGTSRDGHSFVLVDEQGVIVWRADYGGAPDFTMFVPSNNLLADLRRGLAQAKAS